MTIDLPRAVSAAGNNHAHAMLLRDVNKLRSPLAFFAQPLKLLQFGEEWGRFRPETISAAL